MKSETERETALSAAGFSVYVKRRHISTVDLSNEYELRFEVFGGCLCE